MFEFSLFFFFKFLEVLPPFFGIEKNWICSYIWIYEGDIGNCLISNITFIPLILSYSFNQ